MFQQASDSGASAFAAGDEDDVPAELRDISDKVHDVGRRAGVSFSHNTMPPHTQAAVTVSDGADSALRPAGQLVPAASGGTQGVTSPSRSTTSSNRWQRRAREAPPAYGHVASISPHTEEFPGGIELVVTVLRLQHLVVTLVSGHWSMTV
ncbi:hypothetical protein CYMTET_56069 [Cymbomonas tetramitiformis]|uniref:Uncharacterized protein n=1 Tax=Cymbomonas tetramitiformis TaxID=36881 RepID=A0AAE0BC12_9CHLO|nr:hypothetical protein CYMTET_56069 [Cymbomonas tetramitiformis]